MKQSQKETGSNKQRGSSEVKAQSESWKKKEMEKERWHNFALMILDENWLQKILKYLQKI